MGGGSCMRGGLHLVGLCIVVVLHQVSNPRSLPSAASVPIKDPLGIVWEPLSGNPQVTGGSGLSWRLAGVSDPAIRRRTDGSLVMWFTTMGIRSGPNGGYVADGPWTGRAVAGAMGSPRMTVEPEQPVVPMGAAGAWDRYVETPSVLPNDGGSGWTMWYLGFAERSGPTGFLRPALGQMDSENAEGTRWKRPAAPIYRPSADAWDGILVSGPTVFRGPDGVWRLYYSAWGLTGSVARQGIGLLTSKDRVTWTPYPGNPILEGQAGRGTRRSWSLPSSTIRAGTGCGTRERHTPRRPPSGCRSAWHCRMTACTGRDTPATRFCGRDRREHGTTTACSPRTSSWIGMDRS